MNFTSINIFGYPFLAAYVGIVVSEALLTLSIFLARLLIMKKQMA
ncbi:hypothetical protein AB7942_05400 [Neobacillus sp. BF23-41]